MIEVSPRLARLERTRRAIVSSFPKFFNAFSPSKPYMWGLPTRVMLTRIDEAFKKVEKGKSQYLIINVPPRHGKSDIASRRLPVWSLIRQQQWEIILACYNDKLASEMSIDARRCFRDVGRDFGLSISRERGQIQSWKTNVGGAFYSTGIGGTITGRGAHVLIIDDYLKGRANAESEIERNSIWNAFQSDLMTRLAPHHFVLIVANRWHVDDLVGRIQQRNDPKSDRYNPDFPKFEKISLPAQAEDGTWLFSERYSDEWYRAEKAFMGSYAWQAQGMQEPRPRSGNLFKVGRINVIEPKDWEKLTHGLPWGRGWDLASTAKERTKDNPDFTVGTKACYVKNHLYVDDVVRGQWAGPQRDGRIAETSAEDGPNVPVYVETVAGYNDAYHYIRRLIEPFGAVARKFNPSGKGDKVARSTPLEVPFETGRVSIKRAHWNDAWVSEMGVFPAGSKDDQVDSLLITIYKQLHGRGFKVH